MNKTLKILTTIITMSVILTGCASMSTEDQQDKPFDYGRIENAVYTNNFFNFSMNLNPDWVVQGNEVIQLVSEKGRKMIAEENEEILKRIDAAEIDSATLFMVSKYEIGSPIDFNPILILMGENVRNSPGIKRGDDYLFHVRNLMEETTSDSDLYSQDFEEVTIDNTSFYLMERVVTELGVQQDYYSTIMNGFAISLILTYEIGDDISEMEEMFYSIQFK